MSGRGLKGLDASGRGLDGSQRGGRGRGRVILDDGDGTKSMLARVRRGGFLRKMFCPKPTQ